MGNLNWGMVICLIISWIISYFCVWKGVKQTGKVRKGIYWLSRFQAFLFLLLFGLNDKWILKFHRKRFKSPFLIEIFTSPIFIKSISSYFITFQKDIRMFIVDGEHTFGLYLYIYFIYKYIYIVMLENFIDVQSYFTFLELRSLGCLLYCYFSVVDVTRFVGTWYHTWQCLGRQWALRIFNSQIYSIYEVKF